MDKSTKALGILILALAGGAYLQSVAKKEAALLGLTALELALIGGGVGAVLNRRVF